MKVKDIFRNFYSTTDNHEEKNLRSRYYKSRVNDVNEAIKKLVINEKANLVDENDKFGEILFETKDYSCTAIITEITPIEIAIDFSIRTYGILPLGKGMKKIIEFYKYLDSILSFKGIGLYNARTK